MNPFHTKRATKTGGSWAIFGCLLVAFAFAPTAFAYVPIRIVARTRIQAHTKPLSAMHTWVGGHLLDDRSRPITQAPIEIRSSGTSNSLLQVIRTDKTGAFHAKLERSSMAAQTEPARMHEPNSPQTPSLTLRYQGDAWHEPATITTTFPATPPANQLPILWYVLPALVAGWAAWWFRKREPQPAVAHRIARVPFEQDSAFLPDAARLFDGDAMRVTGRSAITLQIETNSAQPEVSMQTSTQQWSRVAVQAFPQGAKGTHAIRRWQASLCGIAQPIAFRIECSGHVTRDLVLQDPSEQSSTTKRIRLLSFDAYLLEQWRATAYLLSNRAEVAFPFKPARLTIREIANIFQQQFTDGHKIARLTQRAEHALYGRQTPRSETVVKLATELRETADRWIAQLGQDSS